MALTYDFFAPFVRVALVNPNGSRLPLWFAPDPLKDAAEFDYGDAPDVGGLGTNLAIVTSVEITQSLGNFFEVTVNCSPTFEDAMALFESNAIRTAETLLEVQYGWIASGGALATRVFVALLTDPDFTIGAEITVTLKGHATTAASLLASDAPSPVEFAKGLSRRVMIEKVAAGFGEPARNIRVDFSGVKGSEELRLLDEVYAFDPAGKNEQLVLRDLIESAYCEVYYTPDEKDPTKSVLKVVDRETRFGGKGNKLFRLARFGNVGNTAVLQGVMNGGGVYPITSVSTQSKQVFIRGVVFGTTKSIFDERKKEDPKIETTQASDGKTPAAGPGASKGGVGSKGPKPSSKTPGLNKKTKGGGKIQTGVEEFPTQKAANNRQEFDDFIKSGIQLSVESVGVPDLEPGAIVGVDGLSKRFDGAYSVLKVMHRLGDGGFSTTWDGINNAGYLYARDLDIGKPNKASVDPLEDLLGITVEPKAQ